MDNANSQEYLEKIKIQVIENLKRTTFAPSVQLTDVPRDPDEDPDNILDDLDEDEHKDQRYTRRRWDKYVEKDGELSESEDEDENESNGVRRQPGARKRRNMMDFQNTDAVMDDADIVSGAASPQRGQSRERDGLDLSNSAHDVEENGSAHSSIIPMEESAASTEAGSADASPRAVATNLDDEDIEMIDESKNLPPSLPLPSADGPQEATPPDSPPSVTPTPPRDPTPIAPAPVPDKPGNDAVDEGDTLDAPDSTSQEQGNRKAAPEKQPAEAVEKMEET